MLEALIRWLPFALFPSCIREGRPEPELLELRLPDGETDWWAAFQSETVQTVQVMSADDVLKTFALQAAISYVAARDYASGARAPGQTTIAELTQWADYTTSLADRLPFGGGLRGLMLEAANTMKRDLQWRSRFFDRYPAIDTKPNADWRASLNLWAADRLMRAINETEPQDAGIHIPPTKLWPAMFEGLPVEKFDAPFRDYKDAQKRVSNFEKTIKPGTRDALMIEVLRSVMHLSPFASAHSGEQPRKTP